MGDKSRETCYIVCPCGKKHQLKPGFTGPVYWCGDELRTLQGGDEVEILEEVIVYELKFRACIPTLGKYCFGGKGLTLNEIRRLGEGYFRDDILWLQYTGKIDTHGAEIYNSDILDGGFDRIGIVSWDDEGAQWVVSWKTTPMDRRRKAVFYTKRLHQDVLVSRIIGNTIENPGLLTLEGQRWKTSLK